LVVHGSPGWSRQAVPAATCPALQAQLPSAAQTFPSAAQLRAQQRAVPFTSCWQTAAAAHCPPGQANPMGGTVLQPVPGVQPLGHAVTTETPPLQRLSELPLQSTLLPSQATQRVPSLLQNNPGPQLAAQQTRSPATVARQAPL
jgi:hypothetical protein